jgi:hypothetical protein
MAVCVERHSLTQEWGQAPSPGSIVRGSWPIVVARDRLSRCLFPPGEAAVFSSLPAGLVTRPADVTRAGIGGVPAALRTVVRRRKRRLWACSSARQPADQVLPWPRICAHSSYAPPTVTPAFRSKGSRLGQNPEPRGGDASGLGLYRPTRGLSSSGRPCAPRRKVAGVE